LATVLLRWRYGTFLLEVRGRAVTLRVGTMFLYNATKWCEVVVSIGLLPYSQAFVFGQPFAKDLSRARNRHFMLYPFSGVSAMFSFAPCPLSSSSRVFTSTLIEETSTVRDAKSAGLWHRIASGPAIRESWNTFFAFLRFCVFRVFNSIAKRLGVALLARRGALGKLVWIGLIAVMGLGGQWASGQVAFFQTQVGGLVLGPGLAIDAGENLYATDYDNNAVKKVPAGCTDASCVITLGGVGFVSPAYIAVDQNGNVYVEDMVGLKEISSSCIHGANDASCVTVIASQHDGSFSAAYGNGPVAVDASGNVYATLGNGSAIVMFPAGCVSDSCAVTLPGQFCGAYACSNPTFYQGIVA